MSGMKVKKVIFIYVFSSEMNIALFFAIILLDIFLFFKVGFGTHNLLKIVKNIIQITRWIYDYMFLTFGQILECF